MGLDSVMCDNLVFLSGRCRGGELREDLWKSYFSSRETVACLFILTQKNAMGMTPLIHLRNLQIDISSNEIPEIAREAAPPKSMIIRGGISPPQSSLRVIEL